MIEALIAGERDPWRLAALAKGRLRAKLEDLKMACDGRFTGGMPSCAGCSWTPTTT